MLITIGTKTINTDHITRIDWDTTTRSYDPKTIKAIDHPCVLVFYNDNASGYGSDEFAGREAALLATYIHRDAINLNDKTPDAVFLGKYPERPIFEEVATVHYTTNADDLPF